MLLCLWKTEWVHYSRCLLIGGFGVMFLSKQRYRSETKNTCLCRFQLGPMYLSVADFEFSSILDCVLSFLFSLSVPVGPWALSFVHVHFFCFLLLYDSRFTPYVSRLNLQDIVQCHSLTFTFAIQTRSHNFPNVDRSAQATSILDFRAHQPSVQI